MSRTRLRDGPSGIARGSRTIGYCSQDALLPFCPGAIALLPRARRHQAQDNRLTGRNSMLLGTTPSVTRRQLVVGTATIAAVALGPRAYAQAPAGPFKLDPLPYANNALEPNIDARTMEIHHDRHHAAYVTNLNNAVVNTDADKMTIEEILGKVSK